MTDILSPESIQGKTQGRMQDLWNFGCLIYYLLVGESPFCQKDSNKNMI